MALSLPIAKPLPLAVSLLALGPGAAVMTPVGRISLSPRLLSRALIDPIIRVGLELVPLPQTFADALAFKQ